MALGAGGGLRPLPGTPSAAGRKISSAAQTPAAPGGGAPLVRQHPPATKSCAGRHLVVLGGVTQTLPSSSSTPPTPRATWTTSLSRLRRTGRGTPSTPRGTAYGTTGPWGLRGCQPGANRRQWPSWAHSSTTARPLCSRRPPGYYGKSSAHGICPEVHYPVPEFTTLAGGTGSTA